MKNRQTLLKSMTLSLIMMLVILGSFHQTAHAQVHINSSAPEIGIGTTTPAEALHVRGPNDVRIDNLTNPPLANYLNNVCVDASGNLIPCVTAGDDLGNHSANQPLQMNCFEIHDLADEYFCNGNAIIQSGGPELFTFGEFSVGGPLIASFPPFNFMFGVNGDAGIQGMLYVSSDKRYKKNIKPIKNAIETVTQLQGVSYEYDKKGNPDRNFTEGETYGFIAQELDEIIPNVTRQDANGYYLVNYDAIIPILTEAITEQQIIIDEKSDKIDALEKRLTKIENMLNSNIEIQQTGMNQNAILMQNMPNPLANHTTIAYELPENTENASIIFSDLTGKTIMTLPLSHNSKNITLDTTSLNNGTYIYTLAIDGEPVASKKMIVQK